MYIPLSTSDGWRRGIYGSINLKKFMKPSFAQPKNISEDQTRNPKIFFLHQASEDHFFMSASPKLWNKRNLYDHNDSDDPVYHDDHDDFA